MLFSILGCFVWCLFAFKEITQIKASPSTEAKEAPDDTTLKSNSVEPRLCCSKAPLARVASQLMAAIIRRWELYQLVIWQL